MRSIAVFSLYFLLGIFLIFSFKKVNQTLNSQHLNTPLPKSFFSLEVAPKDSLRGTVISLSGDVFWQSRTATEPAKITKPVQIQQGEEIVTKKTGQAIVVLSGRANIIIYPDTQINFIQTLPGNILIGQDTGIAEYKSLNNNSFSVRSEDLLVKINQGVINVSVSEKQPYIIIDVKEGSVTAGYNDINYLTQVLDVSSGHRLIFRTDTKNVRLVSLQ